MTVEDINKFDFLSPNPTGMESLTLLGPKAGVCLTKLLGSLRIKILNTNEHALEIKPSKG